MGGAVNASQLPFTDLGDSEAHLALSEKVFVPNTFTPNADGINDVLKFSTGGRKLMKFHIYNRRGELVFSARQENQSWDGTSGQKSCPGGVYVWVMTYEDSQGRPIDTAGHIILLR